MIPAETILDVAAAAVRRLLPPHISTDYFDGFLLRNRAALVQVTAAALRSREAQLSGPAAADATRIPAGEPEGWSVKQRTEVNLQALELLSKLRAAPRAVTSPHERRLLASYSGWGGLSIDRVANRFPVGFPTPEKRGLVHEYYTPKRVWQDVVAHLPESVRAEAILEPSAGVGRAVWPLIQRFPAASLTLVEASAVSAALLRHLFGPPRRAEVYEGFFEAWVAANEGRRFDLILSNPPYGPRGAAAEADQHPLYSSHKRAALYFLERGLDLLKPGGIGVYIIPTGWLTGKTPEMRRARERVLLGHHLAEAFRCPSMVPKGITGQVVYDAFVVDVLIFQRRPATLAQVLADDQELVDGRYYERFPGHILGRVVGEDADWEPGQPKPRRGYQIEGIWQGLPAWNPRPMGQGVAASVAPNQPATQRGSVARSEGEIDTSELAPRLALAVALGRRLDRYLAQVAAGDPEALVAHLELVRDLESWRASFGNPRLDAELRELSERRRSVGAQRFLGAFSDAGVLPSVAARPRVQDRNQGHRATLLTYAEWLYQQRVGRLTVPELVAAYRQDTSITVDVERARGVLLRAGWCLDGDTWDEVHPEGIYYTGLLWPKLDRATARSGDLQAQAQAKRLRAAIGWRSGPDIVAESQPTDSWLPTTLVEAWLRADGAVGESHALQRSDGLLLPAGVAFEQLDNSEKNRTSGMGRNFLSFIGWANYALPLWNPEREDVTDPETGEDVKESKDQARAKQEKAWIEHWRSWLLESDERLTVLENTYNRLLRGYVEPQWPTTLPPVARWTSPVRLHDYQAAALNKLVANRCGLLAFDVGLGKTYTGIYLTALARQQGWARRPVIVVPNSIAWKWYRDFQRVLPDYRVCVIGSERGMSQRGAQRGRVVARPDTADERAKKWTEFQAGAWDVVLLTYSALARTQIDPKMVERYVASTVAMRRSIAMEMETNTEGKKVKVSERAAVDMEERVRQWVATMVSPPRGWVYDPGIDWHALGVDLLMVDEAQNFKNLFFSEREGSADRAAAKRAWALDFRCASTREHTGGTGVVLLSATPAKNAATEFYTMLHLVNPQVWAQVVIDNPESWVSRFGKFEEKVQLDSAGKGLETRKVVTGFQNVDELRAVVSRWATFKVAEDVGLKLPEVRIENHTVEATTEQREALEGEYEELANVEEEIDQAKGAAGSGNEKAIARLRYLQMKRLGIAQRIYLIYLHPDLPGIQPDEIAKAVPESGPKLAACAEAILATADRVCTPGKRESFCLDCAHIVFADNIAVHDWMKRVLVARGIAAERIAVLNAQEVPDIEARQQIVEGFNGVGAPGDDDYIAPSYDIVIANAVAYEGMDLQRRTCAIHHLDVPWDPATLQQRNGRGVRQGNTFGNVTIHFYFVRGSNEAWKVQRIERKRGIIASLVEGQRRATNTTVETSAGDLDAEEISLAHAPPEVRERLMRLRQQQAAAAAADKVRSAQLQANQDLRQAAALWRRVRLERDPERAALLRTSAEEALAALDRFRRSDSIWPYDWFKQAQMVRHTDLFIPVLGPPLASGERVLIRESVFEVGLIEKADSSRRGEAPPKEGAWFRRLRAVSGLVHVPIDSTEVEGGIPHAAVAEEPELAQEAATAFSASLHAFYWKNAGFHKFGPQAKELVWPEILRRAKGIGNLAPLIINGRLHIYTSGEYNPADVLPPTESGWQRYLDLGPASAFTWTQLAEVAAHWWGGRKYPRGLGGADGARS